jgi:DNA (cytosine-5)-methyltransferase 1
MKFIDLFAGLGGFHVALSKLGHECVFASEVNKDLQEVYEKNFGILPHGDIRSINLKKIPSHDILCAGFPCQPFSKAGDQNGRKCNKWGDLFDYIISILSQHLPQYFILENVPNLLRHNNDNTWKEMLAELKSLGYFVKEKRLSPHQFGIPQIRERVYVVGSLIDLEFFQWPQTKKNETTSILSALDGNPVNAKPLSQQVIDCLNVWQEFIKYYPPDIELPSFPIWSMEFEADYPYEDTTPYAIGLRKLYHHRGSHGQALSNLPPSKRLSGLPSYAKTNERKFPPWKIRFIHQNRELYKNNKSWIKKWMPSILKFPPSLQKLEWNCKGEERNIWKYVIQFRASGVRVKRPTTAPSLIAMTTTQVPIIAWERRYMTPNECARLQSLGNLEHLPETSNKAFKALGNSVNADIVHKIASELLSNNRLSTTKVKLLKKDFSVMTL